MFIPNYPNGSVGVYCCVRGVSSAGYVQVIILGL